MRRIKEKVGDIFPTNSSGKLEILSINSSLKVEVKFLNTNYIKFCRLDHIRSGKVQDDTLPTLWGVGYLDGIPTKDEYNKHTQLYRTWCGMLTRCYDPKLKKKYPSYKYCTVCKEWLHLSNFKLWFDDNYQEGYDLDKDLLIRGNKHYSPETCCFIPSRLNTLLVHKYTNRKDKTLPIGVTQKSPNSKFCARCHIGEKQPHVIGYYDCIDEAFIAYKEFKEAYIESIANIYYDKGDIPEIVYGRLLNYEVKKEDHNGNPI